jgi:hypothetical protein
MGNITRNGGQKEIDHGIAGKLTLDQNNHEDVIESYSINMTSFNPKRDVPHMKNDGKISLDSIVADSF